MEAGHVNEDQSGQGLGANHEADWPLGDDIAETQGGVGYRRKVHVLDQVIHRLAYKGSVGEISQQQQIAQPEQPDLRYVGEEQPRDHGEDAASVAAALRRYDVMGEAAEELVVEEGATVPRSQAWSSPFSSVTAVSSSVNGGALLMHQKLTRRCGNVWRGRQCRVSRSSIPMPKADTTNVMWMMTYHNRCFSATLGVFMNILSKWMDEMATIDDATLFFRLV